MRRNKRCLLGYHRARAERIEGWCWDGRDAESLNQNPPPGENVQGPAPNTAAGDANQSSLSSRRTGVFPPVHRSTVELQGPVDRHRFDRESGAAAGSVHRCAGAEGCWGDTDRVRDDQFDKEQPVLCEAGRCGETDTAGVSDEVELMARDGTEAELAEVIGVRSFRRRRKIC